MNVTNLPSSKKILFSTAINFLFFLLYVFVSILFVEILVKDGFEFFYEFYYQITKPETDIEFENYNEVVSNVRRLVDFVFTILMPIALYMTANKVFTKHWLRQNLGKQIFGLKVVNELGGSLKTLQLVKRLIIPTFTLVFTLTLARLDAEFDLISFLPILCCIYLFDTSFLLMHNRKCLHDIIAKSKVVFS